MPTGETEEADESISHAMSTVEADRSASSQTTLTFEANKATSKAKFIPEANMMASSTKPTPDADVTVPNAMSMLDADVTGPNIIQRPKLQGMPMQMMHKLEDEVEAPWATVGLREVWSTSTPDSGEDIIASPFCPPPQ